jgi:hypothetical protein
MCDLQVDLDGLSAFAGGLDRIRSALDATGDTLDAYQDDIGSETVSGALDHFTDHWHDGRMKITDNAKNLSSMVHESVDTYTETDDNLSQAIQPSLTGAGSRSGGSGIGRSYEAAGPPSARRQRTRP